MPSLLMVFLFFLRKMFPASHQNSFVAATKDKSCQTQPWTGKLSQSLLASHTKPLSLSLICKSKLKVLAAMTVEVLASLMVAARQLALVVSATANIFILFLQLLNNIKQFNQKSTADRKGFLCLFSRVSAILIGME